MIKRITHRGAALGLVMFLAGCFGDSAPLKVGSKDFGESKVLSEMVASLAEQEGIPVQRRIGLGSTRVNLEALKRGEIDIYVDYNGTGLVMLGHPAGSDGDAAMEKVRELFRPLGLRWAQRLGFSNDYAIVMRAERAEELGVSTLSDLVDKAGQLTIGVDKNFQSRPLDGLQPMTSRYGLSFGDVAVVPLDRRPQLYDRLLAGSVDLVEGYRTDGQIAEYDLVVLKDDLNFFPVYQAAPVYRADALESHPQLQRVFDSLAGQIAGETMRELNRRVDLHGQSPAAVAEGALGEMGLLKGVTAQAVAAPLRVAASPYAPLDGDAGAALQAARVAFEGRRVELAPAQNPLAAVGRGEARLALVGAQEFSKPDTGEPVGNFEAVGLVGETTLHVVGLKNGISRLEEAGTIAVGAPDSASERTARLIAAGLGLNATLVNTPGNDALSVADAMASSDADAAIVMAPLGNAIVNRLVADGARLLALENWSRGNNLIRYPTLRTTRIPPNTYANQTDPIETLATQLVLAAAGPADEGAAGRGPGASYTVSAEPLAATRVTALNNALATEVDIDPALRQAAALAPRLPAPPAALNPSLYQSALNICVVLLIIWLLWIYVRPERR